MHYSTATLYHLRLLYDGWAIKRVKAKEYILKRIEQKKPLANRNLQRLWRSGLIIQINNDTFIISEKGMTVVEQSDRRGK